MLSVVVKLSQYRIFCAARCVNASQRTHCQKIESTHYSMIIYNKNWQKYPFSWQRLHGCRDVHRDIILKQKILCAHDKCSMCLNWSDTQSCLYLVLELSCWPFCNTRWKFCWNGLLPCTGKHCDAQNKVCFDLEDKDRLEMYQELPILQGIFVSYVETKACNVYVSMKLRCLYILCNAHLLTKRTPKENKIR